MSDEKPSVVKKAIAAVGIASAIVGGATPDADAAAREQAQRHQAEQVRAKDEQADLKRKEEEEAIANREAKKEQKPTP